MVAADMANPVTTVIDLTNVNILHGRSALSCPVSMPTIQYDMWILFSILGVVFALNIISALVGAVVTRPSRFRDLPSASLAICPRVSQNSVLPTLLFSFEVALSRACDGIFALSCRYIAPAPFAFSLPVFSTFRSSPIVT